MVIIRPIERPRERPIERPRERPGGGGKKYNFSEPSLASNLPLPSNVTISTYGIYVLYISNGGIQRTSGGNEYQQCQYSTYI